MSKKFLSDVLIECGLQVSGTTTLGTATATTVATSDNSTNIATTAFVKAQGYITGYTNNYVTAASFNTANGVLTLSRQGLTDVTVDLDNRYLTAEADTLDTVTSRSGVTTNTIGVGTINVTGSTAGAELLTVDGSYGRLFTVTDDLTDSLFSVNTVAGLPALEVFADNSIKLGAFANPIEIDSSSNIVIPGTITASGYNDSNWNAAYNDRIVSAAVTGTTTKTITLNQQDGGTITATWTDINTDTDGYIDDVRLNGNSLDFSGQGSAFSGSVDLSSLTTGNFVARSGDTMTGNLILNNSIELRTKDTGSTARTVLRATSNDELQYGWSAAGPVQFMGGGSYTERMRIHTNGYIGIGNTSPAHPIHAKAESASWAYRFENNTGDQDVHAFLSHGGGYGFAIDSTSNSSSTYLLKLAGGTGGTGIGTVEAFRVTSAGNVGIGVASPSQKLHVNGNLFIGNTTTDDNTEYYISSAGQLNIEANNATTQNNTFIGLNLRAGVSSNQSAINIAGSASDTYRHISFITLNAERMRINKDGYVGIGTTSPTAKLHTDGTTKLGGGTLQVSTDQTFTTNYSYTFRDAVGINNPNSLSAASATTVMSIGSMSNGVSLITTGNVGIGTTNPVAELHVNGSGNTSYLHLTNSTSGGTINDGMTVGVNASNYFVFVRESAPLYFGTNATERMRITSGGNVGIGTTSPAQKLHLYGGNISIDNSSDVALIFAKSGASKYEWYLDNATNNFGLYDRGNSAWRFNVTNSGNVGIGTTNPGYKLEVAGDVQINSTLIVPASTNLILRARTSQSVLLYSNGSETMRLDGNNNVGISTTSPNEKLHVVGNVKIDNGSTSATLETTDKVADPAGAVYATYPTNSTYGAFVDYVVYDSGRDSMRVGTMRATWNGNEVVYADVSTVDIGDTSVVTMTAVLNGTDVDLVVTGDAVFTVKLNVKVIR